MAFKIVCVDPARFQQYFQYLLSSSSAPLARQSESRFRCAAAPKPAFSPVSSVGRGQRAGLGCSSSQANGCRAGGPKRALRVGVPRGWAGLVSPGTLTWLQSPSGPLLWPQSILDPAASECPRSAPRPLGAQPRASHTLLT